jgi:hypothetical protein
VRNSGDPLDGFTFFLVEMWIKLKTVFIPCSMINQLVWFFSMCVLGKRLLKDISVSDCHKNSSGPLHKIFCGNSSTCDPYYEANEISTVRGIKGLSSGVFLSECIFAELWVMIIQ